VWYKGFLYQAASWKTARRVVAKVEFHAGELFPRLGFIVTNLKTPSRAVVRFYNKRGIAEQWFKEGKQAVKMTRLSCHRFRSNEVRLGAEPVGLQPGQFVAATGAAPTNREVLADQFAATAGEDRRAAGETCALLLASPSGRTSEPAAVRSDAGPNRAAAGTGGIADAGPVRIGIGLERVGMRGGVAKVGQNMGQFCAVWVRIAGRQGRSG
jgi:Transposase DDE domain group 1